MTVQTPVYIYSRFSTKKQERGASLERQQELCGEYAARRGWDVVELMADKGLSAWKGDHLTTGNLGKFADRVRRGDIPAGSILLVENLDRLSRQGPDIAHDWMREMFRHGLAIAAVGSGDTIFKSGANLLATFEILMKAQLAQEESDKKSVRVRDAQKRALEAARTTGKVITSKNPPWLSVKADKSGFTVLDDRAAIVREIYQMSADGIGAKVITNRLNAKGIPAWSKGNPTWETSIVQIILKHPAVEGDYVRGHMNGRRVETDVGTRIVGYYPRIVDADLVARSRSSMKDRDRTGGRHRANVVNLFSGLAVCEACGAGMHLKSSAVKERVYRYFQCANAAMGRGCVNKAMFAYEPFKDAALNAILHLALDDQFFQRPDESLKASIELAEATKALEEAKGYKLTLMRMLRKGADAAIEAEIDEVTAEVGSLTKRVEIAEETLQRSRGSVDPAEHIRRVLEVRSSLDAEDETARTAARLKVQAAMKATVNYVQFGQQEGERRILLVTVSGAHSILFDNAGNTLLTVKPSDDASPDDFKVSGDDAGNASVDTYFKRRGREPFRAA